jgi:diaminopimelate decarboxylase
MHSEAWEVRKYLESRGGRLHMEEQDLVALAEARGTPLFVYSERRLAANAQRVREAFAAHHPRTAVCYASKALSSLKVLRLFKECGLKVEVNSGGELFRAKLSGFPSDAIVFNGVAKSLVEIREALSPPVLAINVDSLFELGRIAEAASAMNVEAQIALRVVPGVDSPTSPGNQTGSDATKFGIRVDELADALTTVRSNPRRLRLVGLHCHIGSQIRDVQAFVSAARRVAELFKRIRQEFGSLGHLNIGGGFPLPYLREANDWQGGIFSPTIDCEDVARAVLPLLAAELGTEVEILLEPGRRLVGDCAVLLSRIENVKDRPGGRCLVLDAGYNTLVESYTYKWYYHALSASKLDEAEAPFRLVGPLCDNGDAFHDIEGEQTAARLRSDPAFADRGDRLDPLLVRMPPKRQLAASTGPGDIVAFLDVGAYTLDQLTPNNGRPRPEVGFLRADGSYELLRRRDSYLDLLHNEVA